MPAGELKLQEYYRDAASAAAAAASASDASEHSGAGSDAAAEA
jgi:hypothetical protein